MLLIVVSLNVQAYSNRAASYTKLGAMPEGLKDAEKCIELDPTFSKGYTRKGAIQFFMKDYDKALETYQEGLKHDPNNQELLDGIKRFVHWPIDLSYLSLNHEGANTLTYFPFLCRCVQKINKASRGDFSPDELKERQVGHLLQTAVL